MQHPITAESLLWGLRDRNQGGWLAQELALAVLAEKTDVQEPPELAELNYIFAAGALIEGGQDPGRAVSLCQTPAGPLLTELAQGVDWHLAELGVPAEQRRRGVFRAGQLRQFQVRQLREAWLGDQDNPQGGLACGSYLRPEALFDQKTQTVVCLGRCHANPTGLEEVQVGKIKVVSLDQFFLDRSQLVLGFGKPNVFTLVPPAPGTQDAYQKFDAFMFYRKKTRLVWASVVQSGVFLRLRRFPGGALERLRRAMRELEGKRSFSCAQANAAAFTLAGFTSGGEGLSHLLRPQALFLQLVKGGLEYRGESVVLDIFNTTPVTVEEHFEAVLKKERRSPISYLEKLCHEGQKSAAEIEGLEVARALQAVDNPLTPVMAGSPLRIRNSRPSDLGLGFRKLWGRHILWEALPCPGKIDIDRFLPDILLDKFSLAEIMGRTLSRVDRIKSVVFSRPMVASIRSSMACYFDDMGDYQPGQIKAMIPAAPLGESPILFNLVICGPQIQSRISITRVEVAKKAPDWILSKHVLISAYDPDVRFAGEIWAERFIGADLSEHLRFHLNNNSGTYHPSAAQLEGAVAYLRELFPGAELVAHPVEAQASPPTSDFQKTYTLSPPQFEVLKASLNGQKLQLLGEHFTVRAVGEVQLESEYLDTVDRQLARNGSILRARTRYHKNGKVQEIELEAKAPGQGGSVRIKGATYDSAEAWHAHRADVLRSPDDAAVSYARSLVNGEAEFVCSSWKRTHRLLFGVARKKPFGLGWLHPCFVLSLDTSSSPDSERWHVLEPQVFTRLPWMKEVTPRRLEQFHELCHRLESLYEISQLPPF